MAQNKINLKVEVFRTSFKAPRLGGKSIVSLIGGAIGLLFKNSITKELKKGHGGQLSIQVVS